MSPRKPTRRRSFGSITLLPSKRFRARYRADVEGGWVNAPTTFAAAADAEHWLDAEKVKVNRGLIGDARSLGSVAEIVEEYVASRESEPDERERLAERSVRSYRSLAALYVEPSRLGRMDAADVTVRDVRAWWEWLGQETTVAQSKNAYRLLSAAFGRLVDDEAIPSSPVRIKKASKPVPARKRVARGDVELDSILANLDPRWHFYVKLASYVGPRRGELRGLRRCDFEVDVEAGFAVVTFAEQLHESGERGPLKGRPVEPVRAFVPPHLLPELVEHFASYVGEEPGSYVFTGKRGGPLSPYVFGDAWRAAQDAAGIPAADRLLLHDLRRTAITRADDAGVPLSVSMSGTGHSNAAIHRAYQVPTDDARRAAAERLSASRTAEGG